MKRIDPAQWAMAALWAVLFIGLPMAIAAWETRARPGVERHSFAPVAAARVRRPATPPPPVEPVKIYALESDQARALNAAIPFSRLPNPAARPFRFTGGPDDLARATDCLAAAQIYEAGDDAVGEEAVAQVVLNRVRHPAFPKTVCGVVFQGQERATGCQFTFTCDGALARTPSPGAWDRARAIAIAALNGQVFKPVGHATHYHTDWVVPYWSGSLDKITAVGTHLFFRWRGWWGTPPAFRLSRDTGEPLIAKIAALSPAHRIGAMLAADGAMPKIIDADAAQMAVQPMRSIAMDMLGKTVGGVKLISMEKDRSFMVELPAKGSADSWPAVAKTFCAGRPVCRIMAWRAGGAPKTVPLTLAQMEAMSFSYIHNSATGLQRYLWNCTQTPRPSASQCMRRQVNVAAPSPSAPPMVVAPSATGLSGVRRKDRYEQVKIAPVMPPAANGAEAP